MDKFCRCPRAGRRDLFRLKAGNQLPVRQDCVSILTDCWLRIRNACIYFLVTNQNIENTSTRSDPIAGCDLPFEDSLLVHERACH